YPSRGPGQGRRRHRADAVEAGLREARDARLACGRAAPALLALEELVDLGVQLVGVAGAEASDDAARVDENVRRHSADPEQLCVFTGLVQEDGPVDAPELAVVLHSLASVASLPDIDEDHVQTGPVCFASAQLLEQRRL